MLGNTELVIKKQDGTEMTGTASLPSAFISIEKRTAEDGSIDSVYTAVALDMVLE